MAELIADGNAKASSKHRRCGKNSTRVDLTPMVDLGFLLITFFIFTTTLSQQKALGLDLPHDGTNTLVKNSGALTILLGKNNHVLYYEGELHEGGTNIKSSSFKEIRNVIIEKKRRSKPHDMFVIIKPTDESNYADFVNIIDEMTINVVESYSMDNVTATESQLVKSVEGKSGIL